MYRCIYVYMYICVYVYIYIKLYSFTIIHNIYIYMIYTPIFWSPGQEKRSESMGSEEK